MGIFGGSQSGQPRYSGELHNLQVTESVYGTVAPIVFGTCRVHQKLLFYGGFHAVTAPNGSGKGIFGGKSTEWDYYADVLMLLAQGSSAAGCVNIINVWDQNGKLQNNGTNYAYTIPSSSPTVIPQFSPTIAVDLGVYKTVPYSVVANDYGAGGSRTLTGTQQVPFKKVPSSPGAGQYSFNPATGAYAFSTADSGTAVSIGFSSTFSLYYFDQTQGAVIPSSSPWQVSTDNQQYFVQDDGVVFYSVADGNTPGVKVGGTPAAHYEYSENAGVYTFYSGDAGKSVYITYVYTSSDTGLTNSTTLNLTFFPGYQSQSPWSYMTSKYPGAAFGYSGLCYVGANPLFLGQQASMPSYNYELAGLAVLGPGGLDAHPCDALLLLLTDPLLGVNFPSANLDPAWQAATAATTGPNAYAYWNANRYFISTHLDTQQPAADCLRQVIETGNVAPVWSAGLLKLIPYGDATAVGGGYTYTPTTTPAIMLTWDNLLPPSEHRTGDPTSDDPLQVTVRAPQDCMNYVQAQWTNRLNDYNVELTPEQNDAFIKLYGFRPESAQTWDFITTQDAATWALQLRLKRNCYIRNTYKFWLSYRFSALEPMDMVLLPTGEPVRITQIEDDATGRLAIEAEQWSYGTSDVTLYPKQGPSGYQPFISQAVPGNTYPVIFEATPQSLLAKPNTVQIAVAGNQVAWGGCKIYAGIAGTGLTINIVASGGTVISGTIGSGTPQHYTAGDVVDVVQSPGQGCTFEVMATTAGVPTSISLLTGGSGGYVTASNVPTTADASDYSCIDTVQSQGRTGRLSAVLASHADPDTVNTLSVDMTISGGELVSVSQTQADSFVSLAAIVDASGTMELISYETATLTGPNRYNLTYLRRGVFGTTIGAHAIGAEFVYIGSTGIFNYQYPAQYANQTLSFKFASFNIAGNNLQSLSQCIAYPFTITGSTLQPPSSGPFNTTPVSVLTAQASGADAQISIANFTAALNNQTSVCTPVSPITGLNQGQMYWVYYIDLAFAGGAIVPIATQNQNDFTGKTGYYSLGSVLTPTPSGVYYRPSQYNDSGTDTTLNPADAYDSNPSSAATVRSEFQYNAGIGLSVAYSGNIEYYTLPNITPISVSLYVTAAASYPTVPAGATMSAEIQVSFDAGATFSTIASFSSGSGIATYTTTVPPGTNLNQIQVVCSATATPSAISGFHNVQVDLDVYDINVH